MNCSLYSKGLSHSQTLFWVISAHFGPARDGVLGKMLSKVILCLLPFILLLKQNWVFLCTFWISHLPLLSYTCAISSLFYLIFRHLFTLIIIFQKNQNTKLYCSSKLDCFSKGPIWVLFLVFTSKCKNVSLSLLSIFIMSFSLTLKSENTFTVYRNFNCPFITFLL